MKNKFESQKAGPKQNQIYEWKSVISSTEQHTESLTFHTGYNYPAVGIWITTFQWMKRHTVNNISVMHFHIHVLTGIVYWPQCCPNLIKTRCSHPTALKLLSAKSQANISKCSVTTWVQTKQLPTENQLLCHLGRHAKSYIYQNSNNNDKTFLYYNITLQK